MEDTPLKLSLRVRCENLGQKRDIVKRGLGFFGIILNTGAESDVDANTRGLEINREARNK